VSGAEITRNEPPGHLNALFLTNFAGLMASDYRVAISNAAAQGAFIFWNHPGWKQEDGKAVWYEAQGEFLRNGWLRGIEVVNGDRYDPICHGWCVEKQLALLGNSDAHDPLGFDFNRAKGEFRPMTLVFARERTVEALREAMFARRTVIVSKGSLYGDKEHLEPLFQRSIEVVSAPVRFRGKGARIVQVRNALPIDLELRLNPKLPELDVQPRLVLPANSISILEVSCVSDRVTGEQNTLPCYVLNWFVRPGRPLSTYLRLRVNYGPGGGA
jgi:hypothetical protein